MKAVSSAEPHSRYRRRGRKLLLCVLALAALITLFYAEENWRGHRAFDAARHEAEAQGVRLDWNQFIPPAIPDDQNAAMHPFLRPIFDFTNSPSGPVWRDVAGHKRLAGFGIEQQMNTGHGNTSDGGKFRNMSVGSGGVEIRPPGLWRVRSTNQTRWPEWQAYFRAITNFPVPIQAGEPAADVLFALRKFDYEFSQLAEAVRRPSARYPLQYDAENPAMLRFPHVAPVRRMTDIIRLRGAVRLRVGDVAGAYEDAMTGLKLTETLRDEPWFSSGSFRYGCLATSGSTVVEGLTRHLWNEQHMRTLQQHFENIDCLQECVRALRSELAGAIKIFDYLEAHRGDMPIFLYSLDLDEEKIELPWREATTAGAWRLAPAGWFDQNKTWVIHTHLRRWYPQLDVAQRRVRIPYTSQNLELYLKMNSAPTGCLASRLLPGLDRVTSQCASMQTTMDQFVLACALERSWRETGHYPTSLSELVPKYLATIPLDVLTGEPQKYRRTEDGRFLLYSVGRDGKDDGGSLARGDSGPKDWVWLFPADE